MGFSIDTLNEVAAVITKEDKQLGIMRWGTSNSYPQTVKNLFAESPTASSVIGRAAKFVGGIPTHPEMVVHPSRNLTIEDIVKFASTQLAELGGFAFHCNYNLEGQITTIMPMDISDLRFNILDALNYSNEIGYYNNYGRNSNVQRQVETTVTRDKIKWFNRFSPSLVGSQMDESGVDDWNGQILYYSNKGGSSYPEPKLQAPMNYVLADIENSILVRRETSTGFLSTYLLKTTLASDSPILESLQQAISEAQGSRSSGKVIVFSGMPAEDLKSTVLEEIGGGQNNKSSIEGSKLSYELGRDVLLGRYLIPPVLVGDGNTGFSGSELKDAYFVFNAVTQDDRSSLENQINSMLKYSVFQHKEIKLNKIRLDSDETDEEQTNEEDK